MLYMLYQHKISVKYYLANYIFVKTKWRNWGVPVPVPPLQKIYLVENIWGRNLPPPLTKEKICQIVFHTVHKTLASLPHDFFVPLTVPLMYYFRL